MLPRKSKLGEIFGLGANPLLSNSIELLEMHYITPSGSLELNEEDEVDHQASCNEDPLTGRLSVVDAALSSLPCNLIDKHWQWVTTLDLSRNHIQ